MRRNGFTIMELLIAMSIAVLLVGLGAGLAFGSISTERKIKQVSSQVETAVRRASMRSSIERRDGFVRLYKDKLVAQDDSISLNGARLTMSRPGLFSDWSSPPSGGYLWKFDAKGLSDPVAIKLAFPDGELMIDFDPLTGGVKDRSLTIFE